MAIWSHSSHPHAFLNCAEEKLANQELSEGSSSLWCSLGDNRVLTKQMLPAIYRCLSTWQPRFVYLSHKLFLLFAWKPGRFHFFHDQCFPFKAAIATDAAYCSYLSKGTLYYLRAWMRISLLVVLEAITSSGFWENHNYCIIKHWNYLSWHWR